MTSNTTKGAEPRLVFIDDLLINNGAIRHGEAD
jgi:hypothetical protein